MADAISIQETNKVRVALGLPALPVPGGGPTFKASKDEGSSSEEDVGSTLESRQAKGYDNWKRLQEEQDAKAKREAKNEAIKKARDTARKYAVLSGKGLGEVDEKNDDVDTKTWLKGAKKRQRKFEQEKFRRLEQEPADRENIPEYTAEDLAGVKVGHGLADFEGGEEQVLTLKDTTIEANEEDGDELENLDLKEREAINERLEVKKKKPNYDPNSVDEEGGSTILKHYDEAIDGKKRKRFTLDGQGATAEGREAMKQAIGERLKAQPISLDIVKDDITISDYNAATEAKIRKHRKKKARTTRQKGADEDDIFPIELATGGQQDDGSMDVDGAPDTSNVTALRPKLETSSFVDDDDLQAALANQRRAALKKRKRTKPEDIARQLRAEASATPGGNGADDEQAEEGGLVIDETTEFVANLQRAQEEERNRPAPRKPVPTKAAAPVNQEDEDGDIDMGRSYNDIPDDEELEAQTKRNTSASALATPGLTGTGLDDEATLDQGLGATLSMLSQRGLIKKANEGDLNAIHRERQRFLAEKQKRETAAEAKARAQRERDRASGRLDRMSAREREEHARWENKQRDQQESRQMAEIFNREYKPDVQLKYVDDFGRSMNQKEAFKHLSHQFHGKGSGKQKTEKHLKKIEDEKKREAQSALDSSQATGMNNAMGATAKKNRQAGVRLA